MKYEFNEEGQAIEIFWGDPCEFYAVWQIGMPGDGGLYMSMATGAPIGIFLPIPQEWVDRLKDKVV